MSAVLVDLHDTIRRREPFIIAIAGAYAATATAFPENPCRLNGDIIELADEIRRLPLHEIEYDYKSVLARFGDHSAALNWAKAVIVETRSYYSLDLLVRGRR